MGLEFSLEQLLIIFMLYLMKYVFIINKKYHVFLFKINADFD